MQENTNNVTTFVSNHDHALWTNIFRHFASRSCPTRAICRIIDFCTGVLSLSSQRKRKEYEGNPTWDVINMRCKASASLVAEHISRSLVNVAPSTAWRMTFASKLDPISFPIRAFSKTLFTSDLSCLIIDPKSNTIAMQQVGKTSDALTKYSTVI